MTARSRHHHPGQQDRLHTLAPRTPRTRPLHSSPTARRLRARIPRPRQTPQDDFDTPNDEALAVPSARPAGRGTCPDTSSHGTTVPLTGPPGPPSPLPIGQNATRTTPWPCLRHPPPPNPVNATRPTCPTAPVGTGGRTTHGSTPTTNRP